MTPRTPKRRFALSRTPLPIPREKVAVRRASSPRSRVTETFRRTALGWVLVVLLGMLVIAPGASAASGGDISAVVRRRIGVLSPAETSVLRTISAAEMPIGAEIIAAATGLEVTHATAAAVELERRGLVASAGSVWRVAHDEIGAAALALADAAELRAIQIGLGEARAAQAESASRRRAVRHFVNAEAWDRAATVTREVLAAMPRCGPLDAELRSLLGADVTADRLAEIRGALPASILYSRRQRVALLAAEL